MAGHVRRRKDKSGKPIGGWQVRYPDPANPAKRIEKSGFANKREALAYLSLQQASIIQGGHVDPRRGERLFRDVVESWKQSWPGRLEPLTAATYQHVLHRYLLPEFGARKVASITHEVVQSWVNRLQLTALSPSTVHKVYRVLRTAMGDGVRLGVVAINPCTNIRLPRTARHEMIVLEGHEVAALADAITPHYRVLVYTAAYTGLRAGELGGLQRRDVDLLRGVLHVRRALKDVGGRLEFGPTKTHERRTIALPKFLGEMLAEHLAASTPGGTGPDALVFTSTTGLPLRHGLFYRRHFRPAVTGRPAKGRRPAIVGALPPEKHGVRFHDLRHTCAALSIAAGAHPKLISARLGHSSITITLDRYGHLFPSVEEALADALDAAFTQQAASHSDRPLGQPRSIGPR
jgi:integrase